VGFVGISQHTAIIPLHSIKRLAFDNQVGVCLLRGTD